ncbi:IS3 family transposase [Gemmatimonadota bacterium]
MDLIIYLSLTSYIKYDLKSIKTELIYQNTFFTRDQARQQIFEYIESYYNGIRRHSTLGYKTPVQHERLKNVA